jgi:hypothetical protein
MCIEYVVVCRVHVSIDNQTNPSVTCVCGGGGDEGRGDGEGLKRGSGGVGEC